MKMEQKFEAPAIKQDDQYYHCPNPECRRHRENQKLHDLIQTQKLTNANSFTCRVPPFRCDRCRDSKLQEPTVLVLTRESMLASDSDRQAMRARFNTQHQILRERLEHAERLIYVQNDQDAERFRELEKLAQEGHGTIDQLKEKELIQAKAAKSSANSEGSDRSQVDIQKFMQSAVVDSSYIKTAEQVERERLEAEAAERERLIKMRQPTAEVNLGIKRQKLDVHEMGRANPNLIWNSASDASVKSDPSAIQSQVVPIKSDLVYEPPVSGVSLSSTLDSISWSDTGASAESPSDEPMVRCGGKLVPLSQADVDMMTEDELADYQAKYMVDF